MIIGLTGGIASGKSMIADKLRDYGYPVVDADKIAREIVEPEEVAYKEIVKEFGTSILNEDRTLARKKLGQIIFSDESKRETLNGIMHPIIRKRMLEKKEMYQQDGHDIIVFDIPLLIENKLQFLVDKVLLVYVDEDTQRQRLMSRDNQGEADAANRIASQMPLAIKRNYADEIIDNNGTREEAIKQLDQLLEMWRGGEYKGEKNK